MSLLLRSVLFIVICIALVAGCSKVETNVHYPKPTEKTAIHAGGEDEESADARKEWIELMHGGESAPWRTIEAENQMEQYLRRPQTNNHLKRQSDEWVAGGNILGKWIERGSNNNAGNIMVVDFDPETEMVYAVGGDGPMFKGDLSGLGWQLVNDKLRFSTNLLKILSLADGTKRIISAINGIPYYSDDDGITWVKSTGVTPTTDGWHIYNAHVTSDGKIFFLGKRDYWSIIKAYVSYDNGISYKSLKLFNTSDTRNISLTMNGANDDIYIIEQTDVNTSNLFKFNKVGNTLDLIQTDQNFGFGTNGRANIQAATHNDTIKLYAYNEELQLHVSKDEGSHWSMISTLPTSPWDVAMYVVPSSPQHMLYGEVNAYRSKNGGISWPKIGEWWEYYGDIYTKLHADIMTIKEFSYSDGRKFILNGNHGGLYYSEDYGETHINIGVYGLNVSQYYDVRTLPADPYKIVAGSQDQGLQRGTLFEEETADLFQNISGDYGHLVFTGDGKSLWTVYPGGSISFYKQPFGQIYPDAGYDINSANETVWIPPIISGPDPTKNIVLAAGGSVNENSVGSYIIQLEYINNDVVATQLPFNFATSGGQISAMAIHPTNKNIWFVATTNGIFYKSIDGGNSFVKEASFLSESHYLYGSCILPSAVDSSVVYLSGNGYSNKPVYRSTNGGNSFTDFSVGLPKTMVFNIAANEDESLIFAATEAGPYVYIKSKERWFELSGEITPNQTYWSVEYVSQTQTARFATYGRGVWDFNVKEIVKTKDQQVANSEWTIYPNPASESFQIKGESSQLFTVVRIRDIQGKVMSTQSAMAGQSFDVSDIDAGTYLVEILVGSQVVTKKLVVL